MNIEARLALLPRDRHIWYGPQRRESPVWVARWKDDQGHLRNISLGMRIPPGCPDRPCQHVGQLYPWRKPQTEAERLEAQERGRRGNALRKVRSNKYLKQRLQAQEGASAKIAS